MATKTSQNKDSHPNHLIFDQAPLPMWIYDLDTYKFQSVNQEAVRLYGYSENEFLQMNIRDIRPSDEISLGKKAIEIDRKSTESLCRHQKKDGSIIHVQLKSNLIDFQGKMSEIVTVVDLTENYNQEKIIDEQRKFLKKLGSIQEILLKTDKWHQALKESFQILGEFLEVDGISFFQNNSEDQTIPQGLVWHAKSNKLLDDTVLRDKLNLEHKPFLNALHKGEALKINVSNLPESELSSLLHEQNIQSFIVLPIIINKQFSASYILYDCERRREWNENELQLLKSLSSIFAHLIKKDQIYNQLVSNEARFRSLVQNGNDLFAIIDSEGNYKYVAPTSIKVLGISPEEFIGKNAFDYIHKDDMQRVMMDLEQLAEKGRVTINSYRFKDSQGNWRWIETDLTDHILNPTINGIIAITKDVSIAEEKHMGEQLLASLSRELGQPGSLSDCLSKALKLVVMLSELKVSEVWLISEDKSRLDLIAKSCESERLEIFYENSRRIHSLEKGEGLPGLIWETQNTIVLENLSENEQFTRTSSAILANLNTAFGVPLVYNKEFLGTIICLSSCQKKDLLTQIKLLKEVGQNLSTVLKQKMTEELYRSFFNISPDPHGILGFDGYLKKVNKSFVKLLGYDENEIISKPITNYLHEDDKSKANMRLEALIGGAYPESLEARFITKNRKVIWLVINATVIPESKIFIVAAKDITEQKESSIELLEAYKKLETAQKIAKLGYWIRDLSSDTSEWSEETYRIHGYSPSEFVPTQEKVIQTFHPEDRHMIENYCVEKLSPGKIKSFEHRIINAKNEVKWVQQEISILVNELNIPYKIQGTIQDITERKEYEIQLAISNERFKLATKASNEMIWEIDHKSNLITRSKVYRKVIKYEICEKFSIENSWFSKVPPQEIEAVWLSLQNALKNKNIQNWSEEYKIQTDDGSIAYFVDRCFILRDSLGTPLRSIGSVLDVTSSRKQLEIIMKQNKSLREIAWFQSHVIRAPLSRIMSLIYLAKEFDGGDKSIEEIMDLISISADELDEVIQNIIDRTEAIRNNETTDFNN